MKFNFITLFLASTFLVNTSLGALAQGSVGSAPSDVKALEKAAESSERSVEPSHIMAVINGKNVTAGQLDALAFDMNPNWIRIPDKERRMTILKAYVDMQLFAKAAVEKGFDKTEEYEKRMEVMRDHVLQNLYFQQMIVDPITDSDLRVLYDRDVAAAPKEDEIRARHILVKTKEKAQAIIKRLKKGEKFENVAKKDSTDGSAAVGGDVGYFVRGQMVKPFEDAAFSLKVGEYTKNPVESPFGWHVIKVEDRRLKEPPVFDHVKEVLRARLVRERYQVLISDLIGKADIQYPDPDVARHMQSIDKNGFSLTGEEEGE